MNRDDAEKLLGPEFVESREPGVLHVDHNRIGLRTGFEVVAYYGGKRGVYDVATLTRESFGDWWDTLSVPEQRRAALAIMGFH